MRLAEMVVLVLLGAILVLAGMIVGLGVGGK